jgi:[ribosomal protein S5]-alanine N-acetyltransferase
METILQTERLYLRRITVADAPHIFQLNSDPEVLKYLHERPLRDEADAAEIIKTVIIPQYELYGLGRWAMFTKTGDEFLGWCGLKLRPELDDEIDLGYRLAKKHWGRGYAGEAATACLRFGFEVKQLPAITGRAHIDNKASLHILKKIGLHYITNETVDDCPVETWRLTIEQYRQKSKSL